MQPDNWSDLTNQDVFGMAAVPECGLPAALPGMDYVDEGASVACEEGAVPALPPSTQHRDAKRRACMCRVPFAKPGKDSMDLEVFGMAGVPEGAMPGDPPPDGKQFEACEGLHHACMMPGSSYLKQRLTCTHQEVVRPCLAS